MIQAVSPQGSAALAGGNPSRFTAWEVLWLIGTAVTRRCHPTAETALGDGARPDASVSPRLACGRTAEDAAKRRDAEGDARVAEMMHGLSRRESRDFSPGGISLLRSTAQAVPRAQLQLGRDLRYLLYLGNGKGFTARPSRPRLPVAKLQLFPWQAVSRGTRGAGPAGCSSPRADGPSDPAPLGGLGKDTPPRPPSPRGGFPTRGYIPGWTPSSLLGGGGPFRKG